MDSRAKSELHEVVASLIWEISFRRTYCSPWEEAKEAKEWSGRYIAVSEIYLTATTIINLVAAHRTRTTDGLDDQN